MNKMLDQQAAWAEQQNLIDGGVEPIALDSSLFESRHVSRHVSRHFERRCNQSARATATAARRAKKGPGNKAAAARTPRR
jgi:hypothetical protein